MKKVVLDKGYETHGYFCDSKGNFYSKRQGSLKKLRTSIGHQGYLVIGFLVNGRKKQVQFRAHRIIALTFIPNPDNLPVVDHKNGDLNNISVKNLRWVTRSENSRNIINQHEKFLNDFTENEIKNQIWKPTNYFNECKIHDVFISNLGFLKYKDSRKISKEIIPTGRKNSYPIYKFRKNEGGAIAIVVHKLVWLTFKGPYDDGLVINHINGVKHNCRLNNLELLTVRDNLIHAHQNGLSKPYQVYLDKNLVELLFIEFYYNGLSSVDIRKKYLKGTNELLKLLSGSCTYVQYTKKQLQLTKTYHSQVRKTMGIKSKNASVKKIRDVQLFKTMIEYYKLGYSTRKIASLIPGIGKSAVSRYCKDNFQILKQEFPELFSNG